jgi:hypothetical protein
MVTTVNASTSTGLVSTADTSGIIKLQSNGVTTNALAWVNFNGTGTVAIRSSYNVSSITDNSTGDYTVNFATALSDANYSFVCSAFRTSDETFVGRSSAAPTTSAIRIQSFNRAGATVDPDYFTVAVFGN